MKCEPTGRLDLGRRCCGAAWCPGPESNRYARLEAADFKSDVSTNFTTGANCVVYPRRQKTGSGLAAVLATALGQLLFTLGGMPGFGL